MKTRYCVTLLIAFLLFLFVAPTFAQDATPVPPAASVDTAPVAVVTAEAPTGVTVNVNAPAATPVSPAPSPNNLLSLTGGEILAILLGGGALLVGIGKILWDGNQPGQPTIDDRLTTQIDMAQQNREWIERLQKAYEFSNASTHKALEAVTGVLQNVSPLTGITIDDALLRLLKDIQQPGIPTEEMTGPLVDGRGASGPSETSIVTTTPIGFLTSP